MIDLQVPFFVPLWRCVAIVAVTLGWALVELTAGSPLWAVFVAAIGVYVTWQFFVVWDTEKIERKTDA